jgi:hypothetical protein
MLLAVPLEIFPGESAGAVKKLKIGKNRPANKG